MTDIPHTNWSNMSDAALQQALGNFVRHHRLQQNKSQSWVASRAGISRSTLSLLERGESVTLTSFLQLLRVLDQLHVLQAFTTNQSISPLALAKLERKQRKRASGNATEIPPASDWQ